MQTTTTQEYDVGAKIIQNPHLIEMRNKTICCLVIGMAGSGKTTFMQQINEYKTNNEKKIYMINMDPAVPEVPFQANIDIRDTVNYKQVMKQYDLGPNGAILTSLNLFATRFEQVVQFVEKKEKQLDFVFLDTPGQIEIFTWSASGAVITESLANTFPTCIFYIVDTPRCSENPITFMSNMLYACSIMYKSKIPFVLIFNKTDVVDYKFALEWMKDMESFQQALQQDESYSSSLAFSMCLVLDEFYKQLCDCVVGVSSVTGQGFDKLMNILENQVVNEYRDHYYKDLIELKKTKEAKEYAKFSSDKQLDSKKIFTRTSTEVEEEEEESDMIRMRKLREEVARIEVEEQVVNRKSRQEEEEDAELEAFLQQVKSKK